MIPDSDFSPLLKGGASESLISVSSSLGLEVDLGTRMGYLVRLYCVFLPIVDTGILYFHCYCYRSWV